MRILLTILLAFVICGTAVARDLGTLDRIPKSEGQMPVTPLMNSFDGGEDVSDAVVIGALPYLDMGSTCDNQNDFDVDCPASGSASPDEVYSFTPSFSGFLRIDLCGSTFDTKLVVLDQNQSLLDCNDDAYYDQSCGLYTSMIPGLEVTSGLEYFIVVDGFGGECGDYTLNVTEAAPPVACSLLCSGEPEGEPALSDGYIDYFNGGCNSADQGYPFSDLTGDANGEYQLCAKSGWFDGNARDTDWFMIIIGSSGTVEWSMDAEQMTIGKVLGPLDCDTASTLHEFVAGPCSPATLTFSGNPGDLAWVWIAPVDFIPPAGFDGNEYNYLCSFTGLQSGSIATDEASWDMIKSLYR